MADLTGAAPATAGYHLRLAADETLMTPSLGWATDRTPAKNPSLERVVRTGDRWSLRTVQSCPRAIGAIFATAASWLLSRNRRAGLFVSMSHTQEER